MSILEGVAGGTLGGREGGTESGGFSPPARDFTLDTAMRKKVKRRYTLQLCWVQKNLAHQVLWAWAHGRQMELVSVRRRAWQVV